MLIARYPREQWPAHANLAEMARFWLSRHAVFRELSATTKEIAAQFRGALLKGLVRHLDDEENLIVPLILDRGEEALGVAHHGG